MEIEEDGNQIIQSKVIQKEKNLDCKSKTGNRILDGKLRLRNS